MKKLFLISCCLFLTASCFSQDFNPPKKDTTKQKPPFWNWDKVYAGGDAFAWFDQYGSFVNISPLVGYKITKKYSAGFGLRYIYLQDRRYTPPEELSIYGGSLFNRFLVTDFFFLHAEYQVLNGPWNPYTTRRFNLNNVLVGGGLRQVSGNASMNIIGLWNLNVEPYNPMPNPEFRLGVTFGM